MELEIIEQPQLMQVAKESKIEFTKAEAYAAGYAPFMMQVNELSQSLKEIDTINPTTKDSKIARAQRLAIAKVRTSAEAKKKEDKEIIVIEGRLIDGLYKVVENAAKLTESEYLEVEKHQERVEAERVAKLETERIALLEPYGEINQFVDLKSMDEETFSKYLENEKFSFEAREAKAKQDELNRIEAEKQAEADRLAKIAAYKVERERIEKENAELKAEAEKQATIRNKEREEAAKLQAEKDRLAKIESDKQAKIQAELKAENDRIAAELKAKQEAEEKAHEEEKQRIHSEQADRIAKEKAASLAPDKAKVKVLFEAIKAIKVPEFQSKEAIEIGKRVEEALQIVKQLIINDSKNLL